MVSLALSDHAYRVFNDAKTTMNCVSPEGALQRGKLIPVALERLFGNNFAEWWPAGICPFPLVRVQQGATLIHEGAPARVVHVIQNGYFKLLKIGEDGYEQVLDFACDGELLGCDGLFDGRYAIGAVALEEAWAVAMPVSELHHLCRNVPAASLRWEAAMAAQIARAGDRAWVMGAVGAEKRVARFVLLALRRQSARGGSGSRLRLPMCRRDLASHLGLSHESVSRSFTLLDEGGLLSVVNRDIEVLDPEALHDLACSTRGYAAMRRSAPARGAAVAVLPDLRMVVGG
jgi:CRP/FNR family transcriptional regulator, anaerobic regulatory protein